MFELTVIREKLKSFSLLSNLPEESVDLLLAKGKIVTLQPEKILFKEGSKQRCMYLVLEGVLEVYLDNTLIALREKGEFIGEMAMIDSENRSASVKSIAKTELFEINQSLFNTCLASNHVVVMEILKTVTNRSREDLLALKRRNKQLQEFSQIASHDLQEPIRKIITFGDRLIEKSVGLDKDSRNNIERMQKSALRMKRYLDDLLKFSKIENNGSSFTKVDLNKTLKTVCDELEHIVKSTDGEINVSSLPVVEGSESQLYQLFVNILINSFKYKREDEVPVVNISSRKKENGFWEISIEDNGFGFEEKYSERIFQPFQRLHDRSKYEGSGLGLSICKKIVSRHNGGISAKSVLGNGATFVISLPEKQPTT